MGNRRLGENDKANLSPGPPPVGHCANCAIESPAKFIEGKCRCPAKLVAFSADAWPERDLYALLTEDEVERKKRTFRLEPEVGNYEKCGIA